MQYGINALGLYEVNDVTGAEENAKLDREESFSDISSESEESEPEAPMKTSLFGGRAARRAVKKKATRYRGGGGMFFGHGYGGGGGYLITDMDSRVQKYRTTGSNLLHLLLDREPQAEVRKEYLKLIRYVMFEA